MENEMVYELTGRYVCIDRSFHLRIGVFIKAQGVALMSYVESNFEENLEEGCVFSP